MPFAVFYINKVYGYINKVYALPVKFYSNRIVIPAFAMAASIVP